MSEMNDGVRFVLAAIDVQVDYYKRAHIGASQSGDVEVVRYISEILVALGRARDTLREVQS